MKDNTPIMAAYFRAWRDIANIAKFPENKASMADLPSEVDIAILFPNNTEDNNFWVEFKTTILPALHNKGIKVIRTIAIDSLLDDKYPNNPEGYEKLAKDILEEYIYPHNLDGIDIDLENIIPDPAKIDQAFGVSEIIHREIKRQNGLFIYDLALYAEPRLVERVNPLLDYAFFQSYGIDTALVQNALDVRYPFLPAEKVVIGFSFYEERSNIDPSRRDADEPFEESRAYSFAEWNPAQGQKGGMFAYAVDRDGADQDDEIKPTNYSWTKRLKHVMEEGLKEKNK